MKLLDFFSLIRLIKLFEGEKTVKRVEFEGEKLSFSIEEKNENLDVFYDDEILTISSNKNYISFSLPSDEKLLKNELEEILENKKVIGYVARISNKIKISLYI